jgi:hypothetical protein
LRISELIPGDTIFRELFASDHSALRLEPFEYILSRTTRRPREVIQICTLAIEAAKENSERKVSTRSILQAEEQFSSWKYEHICSENMYIFPNICSVVEMFRGRNGVLSKNEVSELCLDFILNHQDVASEVWVQNLRSEHELVDLLYRVEVIGAQRLASDSTGDHTHGDFDFCYNRSNAKLEHCNWFQVHPALWKTLDIVR